MTYESFLASLQDLQSTYEHNMINVSHLYLAISQRMLSSSRLPIIQAPLCRNLQCERLRVVRFLRLVMRGKTLPISMMSQKRKLSFLRFGKQRTISSTTTSLRQPRVLKLVRFIQFSPLAWILCLQVNDVWRWSMISVWRFFHCLNANWYEFSLKWHHRGNTSFLMFGILKKTKSYERWGSPGL